MNGLSLAMYPLVDVHDVHTLPSDSFPLALLLSLLAALAWTNSFWDLWGWRFMGPSEKSL